MSEADHNEALEEARYIISQLPPIRELADELHTYPVSLLRQVCEEHRHRNAAEPDHVLKLPPYIGETSLRALLEGGLVERVEDQRFAIHAYQPTQEGQAIIDRIDAARNTSPRRRRQR
jgi:hypothetical protein